MIPIGDEIELKVRIRNLYKEYGFIAALDCITTMVEANRIVLETMKEIYLEERGETK